MRGNIQRFIQGWVGLSKGLKVTPGKIQGPAGLEPFVWARINIFSYRVCIDAYLMRKLTEKKTYERFLTCLFQFTAQITKLACFHCSATLIKNIWAKSLLFLVQHSISLFFLFLMPILGQVRLRSQICPPELGKGVRKGQYRVRPLAGARNRNPFNNGVGGGYT